jgi:hypothetical protein
MVTTHETGLTSITGRFLLQFTVVGSLTLVAITVGNPFVAKNLADYSGAKAKEEKYSY